MSFGKTTKPLIGPEKAGTFRHHIMRSWRGTGIYSEASCCSQEPVDSFSAPRSLPPWTWPLLFIPSWGAATFPGPQPCFKQEERRENIHYSAIWVSIPRTMSWGCCFLGRRKSTDHFYNLCSSGRQGRRAEQRANMQKTQVSPGNGTSTTRVRWWPGGIFQGPLWITALSI